MRICILANAQAIHTRRWACAYAERGHDVHVLSIRREEIPGVTVHTVNVGPTNSASSQDKFLSYIRLALSARRRLKRLRPDVINAHFVPTHGAIAAFAGCKPLVVSVWGTDVVWDGPGRTPTIRKRLNEFALFRADKICATSVFLCRCTSQFAPAGKEIFHTPFGVDTDRFRPDESPRSDELPESFRVGFVKTLAAKYGPDILIQAMHEVVREVPQARLIMAGRNLMGSKVQSLVDDLGLSNHVELLGWTSYEELPSLYRSFDVFAHPSVCSEAFGVAVVEASASGLPVVATRVGGVAEVCLDGETGIFVEPNDPDGLAQALVALAKDSERRRALGGAGRRFVEERYVWHDCVDTMLEHLTEAANMGVTRP